MTQAPSGAPRLPIQRLPWTMGMCQRRSVASTSRLVAWWAGTASLVACGSGSARAETSHTVTGRPPRARLACRSTSRLPSAYVSGRVTAAPCGHSDPAAGQREPVRMVHPLKVGGAYYICDAPAAQSSNGAVGLGYMGFFLATPGGAAWRSPVGPAWRHSLRQSSASPAAAAGAADRKSVV